MTRKGNWWNRVIIVSGTFLPLVALGCNSMKQTTYPSIYELDRTGTVAQIVPPHPCTAQDGRATGRDANRRVAIRDGRADERCLP